MPGNQGAGRERRARNSPGDKSIAQGIIKGNQPILCDVDTGRGIMYGARTKLCTVRSPRT